MLPAQPLIVQPDAPLPYIDGHTAIKQIHNRNLQDSIDLTCRTIPVRPNAYDNIPMVIEENELVNMDRHFPHLCPLKSTVTNDLKLKTRTDVPHQKVIDKIVDKLNSKTLHFYNLPFALDALRKGQRKDTFFSSIIGYLEDNLLPNNIKHHHSIIAEGENYLLFNTLLFHFTVKLSKTVELKLALCIPLDLSYITQVL